MRHLNERYRAFPALWERDFDPDGLRWINGGDSQNSALAFIRRGSKPEDDIVMVFNFSNQILSNYRIGVPEAGFWSEVMNSDATEFGGSGVGNLGGVHSSNEGAHGFEHSIEITVPPLGAVWFRRSA